MHTNHNDDHFQILAECDDGYIGICTCCREFNFCYKNTLISFQYEEMKSFFSWVIECRKEGSLEMALPNGRNHIYRTPLYNLFIVYTESELDDVERLYNEACIVIEA